MNHDPSVRFADTSPRCAQGGRLWAGNERAGRPAVP